MTTEADLTDLLPTETASPEETAALAERLAGHLEAGSIVALVGDLGAGKTQFARGLARGLGVDAGAVTSPTFTIVQVYDGRLPVHHFDAYRVERVEEFFELGFEEMFYGDGVTIVEWPERVAALIPDSAVVIRIEHVGGDRRRISLVEEAAT